MKRLLPCLLGLLLAPPAQAEERVLRLVAPWEITSLEPARAGYVFTRLEIAETLIGADDAGLPQPRLAAQWSRSEDGLTWRFALRPGARFHDGTPVSAEAVVAGLRRAAAAPGPFAAAPIAAIEAEGEATVLIRTREPFAALPAFLAHSGTQILAPASFDEAGAVRRVIGSGPYRITQIAAPLRLDAAAFDETGLPPAAVRALSYQVVPRAETRAVMAESGQADMVFTLDAAAWERLRRNARLRLEVKPVPRTLLLKLNAALPALAEPAAREALSLAIDRAGIARAILRNPAAAAEQLFPPSQAEWHLAGTPGTGRDLPRARALLAGLGWQPGPEGVLMRAGQPFRLTLRTFSDRPELPVIAAALQAQWKEIGLDLRVSVANSSEIPAGHRDGTLELALMARSFALVPDPIGTLLQDYGPRGGDWGAMNWQNARLPALLARLGATAEPAERRALRQEAAAILLAERPVIPIGWYDHSAAFSRRLAGASLDPLELSYRLSALRWAE